MFTSTAKKLNFFHLYLQNPTDDHVFALWDPFNEGVCGEKRNENKLLLTTTVSSECRQVLCGTNVQFSNEFKATNFVPNAFPLISDRKALETRLRGRALWPRLANSTEHKKEPKSPSYAIYEWRTMRKVVQSLTARVFTKSIQISKGYFLYDQEHK